MVYFMSSRVILSLSSIVLIYFARFQSMDIPLVTIDAEKIFIFISDIVH